MAERPSNWWMYHGNEQHTGHVESGSRIDSRSVPGLKLLHSIQMPGPVVCIPSVVDGYAFLGIANNRFSEGANGGAVYKVQLATGWIVATFAWDLGDDLPDGHGFAGMGCSPAVAVPEGGTLDEGKVYFSGFNGKVYCLSAADLSLVWALDLRHADLSKNQPVTNIRGTAEDPVPGLPTYSPAAGWSSPVVADGRVYVGIGEGESPFLFSFIFCLDAQSGRVEWIYCTCQFEEGRDNRPNVLPREVVRDGLPAGFEVFDGEPLVRGCSVWSSIAFDPKLNRLYFGTGNAVPDGALPSKGYSNGLMSLDASTGDFRGFFQVRAESSYRPSDNDIDVGASPTLFYRPGVDNQWPGTNPTINRIVVGFGCKNGAYYLLDGEKMQLLSWRQMLPYYNNGLQIPTVDPHQGTTEESANLPGVHPPLQPPVTNAESNATQGENFHGMYSCAAVCPQFARLFMGLGGANYNFVGSGIDTPTTPFMRAIDWNTMSDVWPFDDHDPKRYLKARPPMYTHDGECGLSSPAVVNDVVFCTTSNIAVYAFDVRDGALLWSHNMGSQTGGYLKNTPGNPGGYGFSMGPAVWADYVIAGALVLGKEAGGILEIFALEGD